MLVTKEYDRNNAYRYAQRWALDRNPLFFSFNGIGGDCTNFVSQCIFAGSCVMNYTPVYGWYYVSSSDRAPSWAGVEYFYDFMVNNKGVGPFAVEVGEGGLEIGDVIQLQNREGKFYHTLLVVGFEEGDYLVASHSDDYFNRRLSTYNYAAARFLHIVAVRFESALRDNCFTTLFSGGISPFNEIEQEPVSPVEPPETETVEITMT